ncbi:MAG: proline--tRNA ligase [Phycisphaerae bacterium]|nr:proline--tRNA ligase [Phycisphaerae bacterium]
MKYGNLLIPTTREVPAEAEIPSHRLMIRAGYMRKLASGTYTYLVLGLRSLRKIMQIVREEMDAAGAQEIDMPYVQPMELWEQTGRRTDYGETLGWFTDRHGRQNVLAPTAEEVVTNLVAGEVSSYKQLPLNLYQIKMKYRDEFRPRFGALRSREFIMKDAYSFDATMEGLDATYDKMYDAYCRIFRRCGLRYVVVEAQSGEIGGSGSQEFMIPCDSGEDIIVHTEDGSYAANIEKAEVDPPTSRDRKGADHSDAPAMEEVHTPNVGSIDAVCEFLGTQPCEMIKTLIHTTDDGVVIALVRGDHDVNEAKLKSALDGALIEMAEEATIEKITGAKVGFAGPQGLIEKLGKLVIDHSVAAMSVGVTGANRTDYHVKNLVPGRDFPLEGEKVVVADIRNAVEGDTHDGKALTFSRGIEVGHVFKLGTKYSEKLDAKFLDEQGRRQPCIMGCYGIGINRILASAIEADNDENGLILPVSIAPFEVEVIPLNNDKDEVRDAADSIYNELRAGGADVLLDDRDARPGVKFKDADLIGIPVRVVVGERGLKDGLVEIKRRTDEKPANVPLAEAVKTVREILDDMKRALQP